MLQDTTPISSQIQNLIYLLNMINSTLRSGLVCTKTLHSDIERIPLA